MKTSKKTDKVKKASGARKTSTLGTKIYTYGARPVSDPGQAKIVRDQIYFGKKYYNQLVAIERQRLQEYRDLRASLSPEIAKLQTERAQIESQYIEKRNALSQVKKKERDDSPQAQEIRDLKSQMNKLDKNISEENKRVEKEHFAPYDLKFKQEFQLVLLADKAKTDPHAAELLANLNRDEEYWASVKSVLRGVGPRTIEKFKNTFNEKVKKDSSWPATWKKKHAISVSCHLKTLAARADSNCFSGTYLAIDSAIKAAFKTYTYQPNFKKFDQTGPVGAQIKNVSVAQALACTNNRIKIFLTDKKLRGGQQHARVLIGIKGRKQLLEIDCVFHRPLPEDGIIKWVYLQVKRIGSRLTYELQFTLESATFTPNVPDSDEKIALNFGWRQQDNDDIKVSTIWNSAQEYRLDNKLPLTPQMLVLPAKLLQQQKYTSSLLGFADLHFEDVKKVVIDFFKSNPEIKIGLIENYKSKIKDDVDTKVEKYTNSLNNVRHWRDHKKLHNLVYNMQALHLENIQIKPFWDSWKKLRFSKKKDLFDSLDVVSAWCKSAKIVDKTAQLVVYLTWWARKDLHLVDTARGLEKKIQLHRREIYRCFAKKLATQYQKVVVEKWDKSQTAETPDPEFDVRHPQEENGNKIRHFCGVSVLTTALKEAFGKDRFIEVNPKNISRVHLGCGGTANNLLTQEEVLCTRCEKQYNQDLNAARDLWQRAA